MLISPEWATVYLLALGMILGGFAWALNFFASKSQMKVFTDALSELKKDFGEIQENIKVLFANTTHYQEIIKKNSTTMENVENLFQRIDDKLPVKKKQKSKISS